MKVCVLLPAYNEEKAIAGLVGQIQSLGLSALVVDDGSSDDTAAIAQRAQAIVLRHERNQGKGQALRTGFRYAVDQGYDAVVVVDADGQHNPREISRFIERAAHSSAGILIGNRMQRPTGMPLVRKVTNIVTSFFISLVAGASIPDSQCGFRLIKTDVLRAINLSTINYDTESEILIEASRNKFFIESVPIESIYTDQKSKINPLIDTLRFFSLLIRKSFGKKIASHS